jgi:hypothetical protein
MLTITRYLLYLYPSAYRDEYGEEMMAVFYEVQAEMGKKGSMVRAVVCVREVGGLLRGALREHARSIVGPYVGSMFPSRRVTMRSEFRFPKATVILMAIILGGVIVAIDKARAIQASIPYANPHVGPIHRAQFSVLPSLLLTLVGACVAGAIGWAILFSLHRSGAQRFSELDPSRGQHSGTKSSA